MFTGLVKGLAEVRICQAQTGGLRLTIQRLTAIDPLAVGDSVAVNGVCLTVAELGEATMSFDVVAETLRRTNLSELVSGDRVNLETALRVGDALGGHFVQGHIDGMGRIAAIDTPHGEWLTRIACSTALTDEMIPKGSVAVDGVSLTIAALGEGHFTVALIPTTLAATTLGHKPVGATVNLETDMLGKYVRRAVGVPIGSVRQVPPTP